MRFMMIVKHAESRALASSRMDAIAKLAEEAKAARCSGAGASGPTALGARVRLSGGQVTVTDGLFTGPRRWSAAMRSLS
jgi:hypothetical protein